VSADDRLRLAYIADPNSIHTRRWLTYFAQRGHEVHLLEGFGTAISPGLDPRITIERYKAYGRLRLPLVSSLRARRELRALLGRLRPDVLHAHFVKRYGWQTALAGFHPLVVSPWGSDLLKVPRAAWRIRWWNRRALRTADLVTVTSDLIRDAAVAAGARAGRIELIQHGVDTRRFSPGPRPHQLATQLGVASEPVIFSPRALRPLYRQETVVDAFAMLPGAPMLVLSRMGADPGHLESLRRRLRARGIEERVRIVDAVEHDEMPAYLRLASVVVSVPESDSFPVTALEAMACATPVVVSDLPPARSALGSLAPELIVPVGDASALAAAITRVVDLSDEGRQSLGQALRNHVVHTSDYETNMARMEELYWRLAHGA
jgi:glycosyltransferase involved in cell wall biosynthesis